MKYISEVGGKKGGKKKGGSMQTVSSQFRVRLRRQIFSIRNYYRFTSHDEKCLPKSTGELGQADDKLEEHTPSLCALSDSQ